MKLKTYSSLYEKKLKDMSVDELIYHASKLKNGDKEAIIDYLLSSASSNKKSNPELYNKFTKAKNKFSKYTKSKKDEYLTDEEDKYREKNVNTYDWKGRDKERFDTLDKQAKTNDVFQFKGKRYLKKKDGSYEIFDLEKRLDDEEEEITLRDALSKSRFLQAFGIAPNATDSEKKQKKKDKKELEYRIQNMDPGEMIEFKNLYYAKNQEGILKIFSDEIEANLWTENDPKENSSEEKKDESNDNEDIEEFDL